MRRSLLFMPANYPAMLQNADIFDADGIIFDLEDAVAFSEKDAALELIKNFLLTFKLENKEVIIRINPVDSPFYHKDVHTIINLNVDTIMLPKASAHTLEALDLLLTHLNSKIKIIAIIESAMGIVDLKSIASHPRVNGLLLGAEDLATDLEINRTKTGEEIQFSRSMVIFYAKAFQKDAIDTPFVDVLDEDGLIGDAQKAKSLGMKAKAAIHPNQIDVINQVFSPTKSEIEYAKKIVDFSLSLNEGVFSMDGQMIDKPIIDRAKKVLEKAKLWKLL